MEFTSGSALRCESSGIETVALDLISPFSSTWRSLLPLSELQPRKAIAAATIRIAETLFRYAKILRNDNTRFSLTRRLRNRVQPCAEDPGFGARALLRTS